MKHESVWSSHSTGCGGRRLVRGLAVVASVTLAASCTSRQDDSQTEVREPSANGVRLYVVDRYEGVFRLDPATLGPLDTVDTGPRPHGVVASPDGSTMYITVETSGELLKVDVATDEIVDRVRVGNVPNEPTLSQDGKYAFVPLRAGDSVAVVDVYAMKVVKLLAAGRGEHNAYTSANGERVYVTSMGDSLISVIDPVSMEILRKIPVGGIPRPVAITHDESLAYLALSGLTGFVTLDLRTDEIVHKVELPQPPDTPVPPLDTYTHGMLLTPDEGELWVAAYATGKVYGFLVPDLTQLAEIPVGGGPHWFTLHPDGEPLYVSLERGGAVAAIHRGIREVIRRRKVGRAPTRILAFRTSVDDR
ncbi:MAG: YncE family protein [Gemmatimonadales bacterium]